MQPARPPEGRAGQCGEHGTAKGSHNFRVVQFTFRVKAGYRAPMPVARQGLVAPFCVVHGAP